MSEEIKSESEKKKEDWMNSKWRPMMGWLYMATCTFDFVIFPILWSLLQAVTKGQITQWQPLTLQGAGLYHIAMGAVLGLAAFGRTQEKLAGANNGGATQPAGFSIPPAAPAASSGFGTAGSTSPSSFGSSSFGSTPRPTTPSFSAPAVATGAVAGAAVGFGAASAMPAMDKPAPSRPPLEDDHPELD